MVYELSMYICVRLLFSVMQFNASDSYKSIARNEFSHVRRYIHSMDCI